MISSVAACKRIHSIEVEQLQDSEEVQHSFLLIKGRLQPKCAAAKQLKATLELCDESLEQLTQLSSAGEFKLLFDLHVQQDKEEKKEEVPAVTSRACRLQLRSCSGSRLIRFTYKPRSSHYRVQPLYIVSQDEKEEDASASRCSLIDLNLRLVQCIYAHKLHAAGFANRTFTLNGPCRRFCSQLTTEETLAKSEDELWQHFAGEILACEQWGQQLHLKFVAFVACTRYDGAAVAASGDHSYANIRRHLRGHAALGGGGLALFGSAHFYAWPRTFTEIGDCVRSAERVDVARLPDESNYRRTYGGVYASTLGAVCHELGHCFDLGHTLDGVMGHGFDYLNRVLTVDQATEHLPQRIVDQSSSAAAAAAAAAGAGAAATAAEPLKQTQRKTAEEQNVEDSWECWDDTGDGSDGQGDAAANTGPGLVDIALGNGDVSRLNARIAELEQHNGQLNASLEELDAQHEVAMQDVLVRKKQLQLQVEELRQLQADRMVEHEMAIARQQKQLEERSRAESSLAAAREELQQQLEQQALELKRGVLELAEMQELLEKRGADNNELIDRVRLAEAEREKLLKELDELKLAKEKKTSESSSNSSSTSTKHSEDEFIVVRQADAASGCGSGSGSDPDPDSDPTPPSKEKLRDRLVQLESRIAELSLANGQLQDAQLEKELSASLLSDQLAELESRLRISEAEKEQLQLDVQFKLQQLTMQNQVLKLNAEAEQETHSHDFEQQLDALRADNRRLRQELDASIAQAKFRQAIAEEKQEITDLDDAEDDLEKLRSLLQAQIEDRLATAAPQHGLERAYRVLSERWQRLDAAEQRLGELQEQKRISEHEKKTLEADISQYILQCDELMKNNELLLNELDKFKRNKLETIEEHHEETIVQLEGQLEEARQRLEMAHEAQQRLQSQLDAVQNDRKELKECQSRLAQKDSLLEEARQQVEELQSQLATLQDQLQARDDQLEQLQEQMQARDEQLSTIQQLGERENEQIIDLERLKEQLQAKDEQLAQLEQQATDLEQLKEQLSSLRLSADQWKSQLQQSNDSHAKEKGDLIQALQQKHAENTQYYGEIQRLQPFEQQVGGLVREREKLEEQLRRVQELREKSDMRVASLLAEQSSQAQASQEALEQQASIQRDLERLRAHLLEVEELHTQETVELQRELDESRTKQSVLQHEVSKSSTAYTSASIRANQQAETLQAQHALLQQQRDDLLAKLGQCEDREMKQQAALTNLQCALEQFQNDKEHDIEMATQRIRREMQAHVDRQDQLQAEMEAMQQQLAEANQGLRAAARLSDQLEAGQQTIAVLRDEVESLKEANDQLEQRLNSSESSQTDKIDKSLIKSLLIGYVVSGHAGDKQQVLRLISSVLDFTAQESDKVGLNKQQSSWLGAILGGGPASGSSAPGRGNENLVQAFVQFLEQESQPETATQMRPNLLSMTGQVDATTATTTTTTPPPPHPQTGQGQGHAASAASAGQDHGSAPPPSPPATGPAHSLSMSSNEFAPSRNSSSILKDILSDS
ncbi:thyroid receptor-interacting protein 11-like isoform X2 [Drosophila subobscura]|uniref:thyroid receptor-interacting protein 11-like isoform X2 n=1 Tax=Drosophila subobscura TaxID=7241 RepID=UPI00155A5FC1|nr:thyroid receptor-interacting protein 11-like isoform X2 [Drosophila subobscura]